MANVRLSDRIRNRRKEMNLTQVALAQKMNKHKITIAKWEGGYSAPDRDSLQQLAQSLSVTMEWLLTGEGDLVPASIERWLPMPGSALITDDGPTQQAIFDLLQRYDSPERAARETGIPAERLIGFVDGQLFPDPRELQTFADLSSRMGLPQPASWGQRISSVAGKGVGQSQMIHFPVGGLGREPGLLALDSEWVSSVLHVRAKDLAIFVIEGDAMEPALVSGDVVLAREIIEIRDLSDGLYLLRNPTTGRMLPRRLAVNLEGNIQVYTDRNPVPATTLPDYAIRKPDTLYAIVWLGRTI